MNRPLRQPAAAAPPRALALVSPDHTIVLKCPRCNGHGISPDARYMGLVSTTCDRCESACSLELRIVAARPEWLRDLYPDMGELAGWFVLETGASERALWFSRELEAARAGEYTWGPLDGHPEVYAALGVAPWGSR